LDVAQGVVPSTYVVQTGDSLLNIAQRFGLPLSSIIELEQFTQSEFADGGSGHQLTEYSCDRCPTCVPHIG
jgi:hypothetical protein